MGVQPVGAVLVAAPLLSVVQLLPRPALPPRPLGMASPRLASLVVYFGMAEYSERVITEAEYTMRT